MKICTKCKQEKELTEFSKDKQKKTGVSSACKECKRVYDKKFVEDNKESLDAKKLIYRSKNTAKKQEYDKVRRQENREAINSKKREYYHAEGKDVGKLWSSKNKTKVLAYAKTARAKRILLEKQTDLSHNTLYKWLEEQLKICTYCGCTCESGYHVDHIEPLSKGGEHALDNLTVSCPSCNHSKSNKQLLHWLATKQNN